MSTIAFHSTNSDRGVALARARWVRIVRGVSSDDWDKNATHVDATLGLQGGRLGGHVCLGAGSLHNTPAQGVWVGTYGDPIDRVLQWDESLPTSRFLYVYKGTIEEDGRCIRGTFHMKLMPRKNGTFELVACPLDSGLPLPTLAQLGVRIWKEQLACSIAWTQLPTQLAVQLACETCEGRRLLRGECIWICMRVCCYSYTNSRPDMTLSCIHMVPRIAYWLNGTLG